MAFRTIPALVIPEEEFDPDARHWKLALFHPNGTPFLSENGEVNTGPSAYDVAVANGFEGTEEEWLASLVGENGEDGADGAPGENGDPGSDGAPGVDGRSAYEVAVDEGFVGDVNDWLASLVGPQGAPGEDGADGIPGADGKTWYSGVGAPAAPTGVVGDHHLNSTNGDVYVKTGGGWVVELNIKGAAGTNGTNGTNGATGPAGPTPSRSTPNFTTASIANGASQSGTIALGKSFRALRITTSRAARVRLYTTPAKQAADAARQLGVDPSGNHGLIAEWVTSADVLALDVTPSVFGSSMESPVSADIAIHVTNLGSTGTVSVDIVTQTPYEV